MIRNKVVTRKVYNLKSVPVPPEKNCVASNCNHCPFPTCICFFGGVLFVCGQLTGTTVSNANITFKKTKNGLIAILKPSKYVQYSILNASSKGKLEVKTIKFTNIKNKNKKSALIQSLNNNGILTNKRIYFRNTKPNKPKKCPCLR
ncbi:hypothetical protein [Longirhabdus pacifica]|uniref:hypothetical protein n=1 Tax=Longirhabdus pacifica TaxID=2305227 RepID=UPI001008E295|nr:hypothetical protein [Longirhabdus pacifica]